MAWLDPAGRSIALFGADETQAIEAIWMLTAARDRCVIARIDGVDARDHALRGAMIERGFVPGYKGFTLPHPRNRSGTR
jgi:hypothetical protein